MNETEKPKDPLHEAVEDAAQLLEKTAANLRAVLAGGASELFLKSIAQLADKGEFTEIVERFHKTLEFGTGGLRGRTIGKVVTAAERGSAGGNERPEFPCAGLNAMNYYNVSRATQGLVGYMWQAHRAQGAPGRPSIAIAHDTRHFSKEFAELAAKVATDLGADAYVFEGPRSTPELSFTVRLKNCTAGVVVTASHNPAHDNGYKVYFSDGAQIVEPHATGIIALVKAVKSDRYEPLPESQRGQRIVLGEQVDNAYMDRLETLVLDRGIVAAASVLKIVFTPIHGTGGIIIKPMLTRLGFRFATVPSQDGFDGAFPTVKSPNPENAAALAEAVALAKKETADVVIATDPDCDRMGVAIRNRTGDMQLLTGNQIGSLIAYYRVEKLKEQRVINDESKAHCVIIKTLVTTDLQKRIAESNGLHCVETLTGFKYIGEKLGNYEKELGVATGDYRQFDERKTRELRLAKSKYYVAGGEESYGYSAHDFVRDKDGNAAVVLFAEVCAWAKSRNLTVDGLLDEVYEKHGYFAEENQTITYEGAAGAATIKKLAQSYASAPPAAMDGSDVVETRDFNNGTYKDGEGFTLPKEKMTIFDLADGRRIAVRPSGTEPKIKFYLFGKADDSSATSREKVDGSLKTLWAWIQRDVETRK